MTQIWHHSNLDRLDLVNKVHEKTLMEALEIEITDIGDDYVKGIMPVNEKTKQPYGLLHGGASMGLAETLASTGAGLCIDNEKYKIVGQEINANHLRSATEGKVTGIAKPIFIGTRTQVWEVKIYKSVTDFNDNNLCCIARMTALRIDRS